MRIGFSSRFVACVAAFVVLATIAMPLYAKGKGKGKAKPAAPSTLPLSYEPSKKQLVLADGNVVLGTIRYEASGQGRNETVRQLELTGDTAKTGNQERLVYACAGTTAKSTVLELTRGMADGRLTLTYRLRGDATAKHLPLERVVLALNSETDLGVPDRIAKKPDRDPHVAVLHYGLVALEIAFPKDCVDWIGNAKNNLLIHLSARGRQALREKGLDVQVSATDAFRQDTEAKLSAVADQLEDSLAYLAAMRIWELPVADSLFDQAKTLQAEGKKLTAAIPRTTEKPARVALWKESLAHEKQADQFAEQVDAALTKQKDALFAKVRNLNRDLPYRIGLSYDADPREGQRLLRWAVFNMTLFRLNTGWVNRSRGESMNEQQRIEASKQILAEADRAGIKAIVVVNPRQRPLEGPEEFTFDHHFLPRLRPSFYSFNFNSAPRRQAGREAMTAWAAATKDIANILCYQIGNEPFWSTMPNPIFGYDVPTIGCSNETFRRYFAARYKSPQDWRKQIEEPSSRDRRRLGGAKIGELISWQSMDQVGFDAKRCEGLSFVQFLKDRYQTLDALNHTWFGDNRQRYFAAWDDVFPPLPVEGNDVRSETTVAAADYDIPAQWVVAGGKAPRSAAADVPAWMDWAAFWAHSVADYERNMAKAMHDAGARAPATTNCVAGHFINGFNNNAADTGMIPWVTPADLDTVSIDFYACGYLHAYIRSLTGVSNGRPIYVHETGAGSEGRRVAYMALYPFAYGADSVSFWSRDQKISPRFAIELLRATRALADADLQRHTKPVADGVKLLYSLPSLYLADATTGTGSVYARTFQGATLLLDRLQVLYDVCEDSQLVNGVPSDTRLLYMPGASSVSDAAWQAIRRYVEGGGCLAASPAIGRFDQHGRPRPAAQRAWLQESKNILLVKDGAHEDWRKQCSGDHFEPRMWLNRPLPEWSQAVDALVRRAAPRTVTYLDPATGRLGQYAAAARRGDGNLYVFVDPWAGPTRLEVRGNYRKARDLYQNASLSVAHRKDTTTISLESGPAVIRLDRAEQKNGENYSQR